MTGQLFLTLMHTRAGAHKVYVQGHADGHIMDWNGCNFRYFSVPGQPLRGFPTKTAAKEFLERIKMDERRHRSVLVMARSSTGAWLTDDQVCGAGCIL